MNLIKSQNLNEFAESHKKHRIAREILVDSAIATKMQNLNNIAESRKSKAYRRI
ncbi:hypothetical protein ACWIUD_00140 [Helicobacter sp. 23-1044]